MTRVLTYADLFSGCGGATQGAIAAGFKPIWGVECVDKIADAYELNFPAHIIRAKVEDVDYECLERPDWLHMSPVCTRASAVTVNSHELHLDTVMASACTRAISELNPSIVTLENVWSYRNFESFKHILEALEFFGYQVDYWHLNAADFGVPQTRSRLMLVALQDVQPNRPQESAERQSWYSALSPILPEDFETAYPGHGQEPVIDSVKSRHNVSFQIPQITFGARAGAVVRFQDEPSVTLLASKIDRIRFWIQEQHRLVRPTGRVAARLQGFPDTFKLPVDQKLAFHTIGNSVCPPVLTAVIKAQGY